MEPLVQTYTGGRLEVTAGRVTTIDIGSKVLDVTADPEGGNATLNPDGTLALVLPDPDQRGDTSFTVLVEGAGGPKSLTVDLRAAAGSEDAGWGAGDFYTLATDSQDQTVVEPGENHRKVYVTGSKDALSLSDIAAREGLNLKQVDSEWLVAHPEYGASEGMALDTEAGMKLWYGLTGRYTDPGSQWLLFEKGYVYEGTDRIIDRGTSGESALHPVLVSTWGKGARPVIEDRWSLTREKSENIVFKGLDFAQGGEIVGSGENVILDDVILRNNSTVIQGAEHITLRNAQILDVSESSKTNGIYVSKSGGLLIENVLADHNGWEDGWKSGDGNAPNAFNHNIYVQWNNLDVTYRDNVTMQGSSFGAQIRSGGVIENNAFLDNNIALNIKGGNYRSGQYIGNYSLLLDNVVSSGAHKDAPKIGGITWGIQNLARDTSLIGNIIAHLADPDDPQERAEKTVAPQEPLKHKFAPFVDDTIIYNWVTDNWRGNRLFQTDQNVPDVGSAQLDEVTLRNFVTDVLGKAAGEVIETLAGYLRENWSDIDGADIVRFFQGGFEIERAERSAPTDLSFVPDMRGDGMRWDNRLNWSTEDRPIDGDRVDLSGNWVTFSGTVSLAALDLGDGGELTVRQGRLDVDDLATGEDGKVLVGLSGQFWADGYDGAETLTVAVDGGRFANTGVVTGPSDITVAGGEALLATGGGKFDLDGSLRIDGAAGKVGFDGAGGNAVLTFAAGAELEIAPDADGIASIREFRSGAWGLADPNITSALDLGRGDTLLTIDLSDRAIGTKAERMTLAEVDVLTGGFGTIAVNGARPGDVTMRIDYAQDRVELITQSNGGSASEMILSGSAEHDVFVVADGIAASVENYERSDSIDFSAALDAEALKGLSLDSKNGQAVTLVDAAGRALAEVEGTGIDRVWVRADGWEVDVSADGAGSAQKLPDSGPVTPPPAAPQEPTKPTEPGTPTEPTDPGTPTEPTEPGSPTIPPNSGEPEEPVPNTAPVAEDGRVEGAADAALTGQLSATDADGDPLVFMLVGAPKVGDVTLGQDGSFSYDAGGAFDDLPLGETQIQRFDFRVSDGEGGRDRGSVELVLNGAYEPPVPEAKWNQIVGTAGFDILEGTNGADLIRSGGGGYDRIWGADDADAFVFGAGARDGVRASDHIFDFDAGEDMLVLEKGAEVADMSMRGESLWVKLEGDRDLIILEGTEIAPDEIQIIHSDAIWMG